MARAPIKTCIALLLLALLWASLSSNVTFAHHSASLGEESFVEAGQEGSIVNKFEPRLWDKLQELRSNGTERALSLIIRLVEDERRTSMSIRSLKNYVVSLFESSHSATVYSILEVLPIIMAKVPVAEATKIAAYRFVESVGDGEGKVYGTLDVSRQVIRADYVKTNLGYDGSGKIIAILDSGINSSHPDLNDLDDDPATCDPKVIYETSCVDWGDDGVPDVDPMDHCGHGTMVAGVVAGTGEAENYQYVGVAPQSKLLNIKVLELGWEGVPEHSKPRPEGEPDDIVNGIEEAISQGADVICLSLGDEALVADGTNILAKTADDAVENGVVVVVAAGNQGPDPQTITAPGDAFNVITVGASNDHNTVGIGNNTLWIGSSRGPTGDDRIKPDVVAPGENLISTISSSSAYWEYEPWEEARVGDFYFQGTGTSAAAPHVAGTAALMLQANPNLTPAQIKAILKQTARLNDNLAELDRNDRGYGIIDAYEAVQLAQNVADIDIQCMYDGFWVETPLRWYPFPEIMHRDCLTFSVSEPFDEWGMNVAGVEYHLWWLTGARHYELLYSLNARHVWIDDTYYDLGTDMNRYLFSGPRIYETGAGYVMMRALYKVGDIFVEYRWKMGVDEMWLKLKFEGASSWRTLIYIDPNVWDTQNYARLPSTGETIQYERTIYRDVLLDIRDPDPNHPEYIQIDPNSTDNPECGYL